MEHNNKTKALIKNLILCSVLSLGILFSFNSSDANASMSDGLRCETNFANHFCAEYPHPDEKYSHHVCTVTTDGSCLGN
jgi:hypothetical protein